MKKIHTSALLSVLALFLFALTTPGIQNATAAADKPKQTVGEYIDDSVVTAGVKRKVLEEKELSALDLSVPTHAGVVTLSGKIDTLERAQLAERTAKQVDGVKNVVNDLLVDGKKTQSAAAYIDDATITAAVKAYIMKEKRLSTLDISVKTQDGIVTLTGSTDTAEHAKLAESTAKKVDGVKQVTNMLITK